jgi:hypothetical protein
MRSLRAAVNDFARTNATVGEIEALHADVNRMQAEMPNCRRDWQRSSDCGLRRANHDIEADGSVI